MINPCDSLLPGHREICEGTSGHTPQKRHAYMMQFVRDKKIPHLPDGYTEPTEKDPPKPPRGLGDTVKQITDMTGLTAITQAIEKVTGLPCGCARRQEWLNNLLPYKKAAEAAATDSVDPSQHTPPSRPRSTRRQRQGRPSVARSPKLPPPSSSDHRTEDGAA